MSDATTALAEALRAHETFVWGFPSDYACKACPDERWHEYQDALLHVAAAVVAAVRGMSPDLQAELIGGEATTEWAIKWDQNDVDFPFLSRLAAASVAEREHLDAEDTYRIESRAFIRGPWTPEQAEETEQ